MSQRVVQVDAFTSEPFGGNPAAVCVMDRAADEGWMQKVAREMNLSETAFLYPTEDGYHLRWFTPAAEVELCGHATLASSHVLWEDGYLPADSKAVFHTLSGQLTAVKNGDWIQLEFPANPPKKCELPEGLVEALGAKPVYTGETSYQHLLEFESDKTVRTLAPDFGSMLKSTDKRVIVTAADSSGRYDFVSRFFAPPVGINEDPVTGSAHCALTPYWSDKLGKLELSAYQASARGGVLKLKLAGERVLISGQAVTVLRGELV